MTTEELHILISQGLQAINSFAYQDMLPEEVDLEINNEFLLFVREKYDSATEKRKAGFHIDTKKLNDLRTIQVKDASLTLASFSDGRFATLPSDYLYYINSRTEVKINCVKKGKQVSEYKTSPNRLIDQEVLHEVLEYSFTKTNKNSAVANISRNEIYIYSDGFFAVNKLFMDYIRKPTVLDINTAPTAIIEFNDDVCALLSKRIINRLAKVSEQPQQKIVNLDREANENN